MKRSHLVSSLSIFAAIASTASAQNQGQPVSFYVEGTVNNSQSLDVTVPSGFVLTDVVAGEGSTPYLIFYELATSSGPGDPDDIRLWLPTNQAGTFHLGQGIPFSGAVPIRMFSFSNGAFERVTLVGYLPTVSGVPAMGQWGATSFVLLLLIAGTTLMRRRRAVVTA